MAEELQLITSVLASLFELCWEPSRYTPKAAASLVYAAEDNAQTRAVSLATAGIATETVSAVVRVGVLDQVVAYQMLRFGILKGKGRHFGAAMRFGAFKQHAGLD